MKWPAKPIVAIGNTWLPCAADEDPTLGSLRHLAAGREGSTRIFLTPGNSIGEDVDGEPILAGVTDRWATTCIMSC